MLMMKNFGLIAPVDEQRADASLFANALRRPTLLDTERCFGLAEVRAKDEANALATKRDDKQMEVNFMFSIGQGVCESALEDGEDPG